MVKFPVTRSHYVLMGSKEEIKNLFFTCYEKSEKEVLLDFGHLDSLTYWSRTGQTGVTINNRYLYLNYATQEYTETSENASIQSLKKIIPKECTHYIVLYDETRIQKAIKEKLNLVVV